jgi:hypothetical protein
VADRGMRIRNRGKVADRKEFFLFLEDYVFFSTRLSSMREKKIVE